MNKTAEIPIWPYARGRLRGEEVRISALIMPNAVDKTLKYVVIHADGQSEKVPKDEVSLLSKHDEDLSQEYPH